jgi:endonuclease III
MLSEPAIDEIFRRLAERKPDENVVPKVKVKDTVFKSLVSVMLSAQSRDVNTARATAKLFAVAQTPTEILALDEERLQELIKDAGLYRMKARNIRRLCQALLADGMEEIPRSRDALMRLPGVGRKSADIMLRFVFGEAAIAVDTHVFRVSNRLGLARGRVEAQVARQLETRVPARWRWGAHIWLLEHGKEICRSRRPRCEACYLADLCEQNGVGPGSGGELMPPAAPIAAG